MHEGIHYRKDIDGLRAASVLAVVAFHANLQFVPGGFAGVDIFFVISGYLIMKIIDDGLERGSFSFMEFYKRRILRIVPALLVMLLATILMGSIFLFPRELVNLGYSVIATILSASNILFYYQSDYFDASSLSNPLLNTWSLGVEEQFYIAYPLFAWISFRYNYLIRLYLLLVLTVFSLALSEYLCSTDVSAGFYMMPSRFWELSLGGFASIYAQKIGFRGLRFRYLQEVGIILIAVTMLFYNSSTKFPGFAALLPCFGAFFVLLGGQSDCRSLPSRWLLENSISIFFGRISYSLYLWHWPLIVYQRNGPIVHSGFSVTFDKVCVMALLLIVSAMSYKFVEIPFRRGFAGKDKNKRLIVTTLGSFLVPLLLVPVFITGGLPSRFNDEALRISSFLQYDPDVPYRAGKCFLTNRNTIEDFDERLCFSYEIGNPISILIGDSHAADIYSGLSRNAFSRSKLAQVTATGCKPVLRDVSTGSTCGKLTKLIFEKYVHLNDVKTVLLSARWNENDVEPLLATIRYLNSLGLEVIVIGPTPEFTQPLPRLLARIADGEKGLILNRYLYSWPERLDGAMRELSTLHGFKYVSLYNLICRKDGCNWTTNNDPIYFDGSHFTEESAVSILSKLSLVELVR